MIGEGIEDYSDEEDGVGMDHHNAATTSGADGGGINDSLGGGGDTTTTTRKQRTYSTDSFIKNLQKHGELQQYRMSPVSASSLHGRSGSVTSQHHARISSGYLPGVPDGSVMMEHHDDSDEDFITGFQESMLRRQSSLQSSSVEGGDAGGGEEEEGERLSQIQEEDDTSSSNMEEENNPMKPTTATKNLTTMGQRLKMMQKAGSSSLSSSFRRSTANNNRNAEGSGDALFNALSNVSKDKKGNLFKKMKYEYTNLIAPQMPRSIGRISRMLFFFVFPLLGVATLLFYLLDNPTVNTGTSVSWYILFAVRQALLFEFARIGEVFWVEIMALRSRLFTDAFGPYVALAIIQSKGWPYMCIFWPVLDFCFLYGSNPFVRHWVSYIFSVLFDVGCNY